MKMRLRLGAGILALAWYAIPASSTLASSLTWTGAGSPDSNNWFNGANWSGGSGNYPQDGDSVTIASGKAVLLTNSTAWLADFTINTTNFTFTDWTTALRATNITVQASGGLTHAPCDTNAAIWNTNRVYIVCSNLTVLGTINVNYLGYRGSVVNGVRGQGPGGSIFPASGSYGGRGGDATSGPTYGYTNAPSDPGSGGGGSGAVEYGGHGGGAVWIEASGSVVVNGTISADGRAKTDNAGGGSGGSIYINCNTFAATNGTLRAQGGNVGAAGYGAGGGRIAMIYDLTAQHTLNLTDRPLLNVWVGAGNNNSTRSGAPGTLYLPDASFFPATNNILRGGQLLIQGFSAWAPDSLTISSGLAIFPTEFSLTVTNDLLITGTGGGIQTSNAVVSVGRDLTNNASTPSMLYGGPRSALTVGRDLIVKTGAFHWYGASTNASLLSVGRDCMVTNGGTLHLHAGATNGVTPDYGARVTVGGTMIMASNSWIMPYSDQTNGGSVYIEASKVMVQAYGGIDADAKGYGAHTWGSGNAWGYGPGAGYISGGAGQGGAGGPPGVGGGGTVGGTYGSSNAPTQPGSGGGTYGGVAGGMGGGLVWLNVQQTLTLDGYIRARGNVTYSSPYSIDVGGGGSGGGIYIRCRTLAGGATGRILADGGVSSYTKAGASGGGSGGSGGGGRIAVWWRTDNYTGSNSVAPGQAYDTNRTGKVGTIVWGQRPMTGMILFVK